MISMIAVLWLSTCIITAQEKQIYSLNAEINDLNVRISEMTYYIDAMQIYAGEIIERGEDYETLIGTIETMTERIEILTDEIQDVENIVYTEGMR